jgi:hypothetical protein
MNTRDMNNIKRRSGSYALPNHEELEAWFYTNTGSIDLVIRKPNAQTLIYRLRVSDMEKIVKALRSKP